MFAVSCLPIIPWTDGRALAADEIHWTLTGPASVTFNWRGTSAENTLQYGLAAGIYTDTVTADNAIEPHLPFSSSIPFWEAKITGLQGNTIYHYSISGGPDHVFHTPPPRGDPGEFTVSVQADIGSSLSYDTMRPVQQLIADAAPAFVLMPGDLTYGNARGQGVVDRHFNDVMLWSQDAAYMPAWGNHEWTDPTNDCGLRCGETCPTQKCDDLRNYKGRFDLPNSQTSRGSPSVGCCGEDWYWFDYAHVRFIAYPEPWSGAWSEWNTKATALMDEAQSDPAITFIVTFGHRPAYSSGHHPGSAALKAYLDALGAVHDKYVLNINGHSHNYERTVPQNGVVHLTVGTGGSFLEQDGSCLWLACAQPSWSAFRAMYHGVARLRFTATGIEGAFICGPPSSNRVNEINGTRTACTYGSVIDSFTIAVPGGRKNSPPSVDAGPDQSISLPWDAALAGTVADDGLPFPPGRVLTTWTVDAGPGTVTFADPQAVETTASFSSSGTYVLRLSADDGMETSSDTMTIEVGNFVMELRVSLGADDAEEAATGAVMLASRDLQLITVGLRFGPIPIVRGAAIRSAWVQLKADDAQSGATSLVVHGQAADNAPPFARTIGDISTRVRTGSVVPWSPAPWTIVGETGPAQRTPDLAAIIQEIVDRPGWSAGNSMALIVTGTGRRTAESYEAFGGGAPLLHLELSEAPPNLPPTVRAGPDQSIRLPLCAALDGEVSDDGQPSPSAAVGTTWSMESGPGVVAFVDAGATDTWACFSTSGSYVLRLTAHDGERTVADDVSVVVDGGGPVSVDVRVATGADDAEERSTGDVMLASSDLELVFDGNSQSVGLRFGNIPVPRGVSIKSAWVQFRAAGTQSEPTALVILGEAIDNAPAFHRTTFDVSSRVATSAAMSWSPAPWTVVGEAGPDQRTPDLSGVIQEVVDRPGWAAGNSLVLMITGNGRRTAESFDGSRLDAPLLHLEF